MGRYGCLYKMYNQKIFIYVLIHSPSMDGSSFWTLFANATNFKKCFLPLLFDSIKYKEFHIFNLGLLTKTWLSSNPEKNHPHFSIWSMQFQYLKTKSKIAGEETFQPSVQKTMFQRTGFKSVIMYIFQQTEEQCISGDLFAEDHHKTHARMHARKHASKLIYSAQSRQPNTELWCLRELLRSLELWMDLLVLHTEAPIKKAWYDTAEPSNLADVYQFNYSKQCQVLHPKH